MMKSEQADRLRWFKSTYSGGDGGECIEIAPEDTVVHIRDSKERTGPQLAFARDAWTGFVAGIGRRSSAHRD